MKNLKLTKYPFLDYHQDTDRFIKAGHNILSLLSAYNYVVASNCLRPRDKNRAESYRRAIVNRLSRMSFNLGKEFKIFGSDVVFPDFNDMDYDIHGIKPLDSVHDFLNENLSAILVDLDTHELMKVLLLIMALIKNQIQTNENRSTVTPF